MADNVARLPPNIFGRRLSDAELEEIRTMLEGMDSIDAASPEIRELIETRWPDLAAKLAPK